MLQLLTAVYRCRADPEQNLRDWQRARAQVRDIAAERDRAYAAWADRYEARIAGTERWAEAAAIV